MNTLTFRADKEIFEKHPGFRRAVIVVRDVSNKGDLSDQVQEQVASIKALDPQDVRLTAWSEAFAVEGMKVRDFRPSIIALVKRIQADKPFGAISTIVDIGTIASLKFVLPAGAHPILADTTDVTLEYATGDEIDISLEGKTEIVPAGELVLKDNGRIATRRWVWRQAPISRIDNKTTDFYLMLDALSVISDETLSEAVQFSQDLIQSVLGVKTEAFVLSKEKTSEEVSLD
ncbi:MAG: phenylalanine--tRNA ligase beta subunit-related protein [Candidatus Microsaccharimonas sp.]